MAQPLAAPYSYFADSNGLPLAGGKIYTYIAGTTTPQASYTDSTGGTPLSNPVILDSAGRAQIWLSGTYKIVVKDSLDNTISTTDNLTALSNSGDMTKAVYDPANIAEQLVGLTATQSLSNKSATTQTADTSSLLLANMAAVQNSLRGGGINKFRNGTFDVWQRGTSGTITAGSPAYSADGWIISSTGANVPWAQVTGRASTSFGLKVTGAASVTDVLIKQRIESYLAAMLYPNAAAQITVQAKIYNNTGSAITPTLTVKHATATDNFGTMTTDVNAVSLQSCTNTSLTTVGYTFASVSGMGNGVEVTIDFGNNFTTNGKSVEVFEWDIRVTPGVTTGLNSTPPLPELRNIQVETALCQRYLPAFNANGVTTQHVCLSGYTTSSTAGYLFFKHPVTARSVTTGITVSNVSHFFAFNANFGGGGAATSALTFDTGGVELTTMAFTVASGQTADVSVFLRTSNSSAQLLFTGAEL